MMNLRPFQLVLLGVFVIVAVGSLIFFANYTPPDSLDNSPFGTGIEIWGTLDSSAFNTAIDAAVDEDNRFEVVTYRQIDERSFDSVLLNAIAEGKSPDLIVLPHESIVTYRSKLFAIPYDSLPKRVFLDTYVEGAEIFALSDGIFAFPFAVDPMIMYWNRDIFTSDGIAGPPTTWEILRSQTTPTITERTPSLDIITSSIAFGEYSNIRHAKEILSLLAIQSGSKMVVEDDQRYEVDINTSPSGGFSPFTAALGFYTEFSNRALSTYSWNRALPEDRRRFLSGDLALYFGFGSEVGELQRQNPNLNFDVASVPQGAGATTLRGYGTFYGLAIPLASTNSQSAFAVAAMLGREDISAVLASALNFAPVHKNTISRGDSNPFRQVLMTSALIARGWLDPSPIASDNIFKDMIENVTSGRLRVSEAVSEAESKLKLSF